MKLPSGIVIESHRIAAACGRAGVRRAYLFGSVLTDRFGPDSDIDVLVETDPANPVGLFRLGGLQMELTELLGRPVHMSMLAGIPPRSRQRVLNDARLLDAA